MKNIVFIGAIIVIALGSYFVMNRNVNEKDNVVAVDENSKEVVSDIEVTPISHATVVLSWGGSTIYTDPVGGGDAFDGKTAPDIVLLTDIHGDHLSVETLEEIIISTSVIIAPQAVADKLTTDLLSQTVVIANGQSTTQGEFVIEAIPMYNLPESTEAPHTKGRGNGYVVERESERVYIAGDTAGTPEMRALTDIDIAFIPMNLPYTMTVDEAADAVLSFAPKQVYPYHYKGTEGLSDVGKFKELVNAGNPDIEVTLLTWYPDLEPVGEEAVSVDNTSESAEQAIAVIEPSEVVRTVSGFNFGYDVEEIRVKEGDTVTINFSSSDGYHDWVVDEFDAATSKVDTGNATSVTFVADTKGSFEYYCSVGMHRAKGMIGTLIVE